MVAVGVRGADSPPLGRAVAIRQHRDLRAGLAPADRVRPAQISPFLARTRAASAIGRGQSISAAASSAARWVRDHSPSVVLSPSPLQPDGSCDPAVAGSYDSSGWNSSMRVGVNPLALQWVSRAHLAHGAGHERARRRACCSTIHDAATSVPTGSEPPRTGLDWLQ